MSQRQIRARLTMALVVHLALVLLIRPGLGLFSTYRDPRELLLMLFAALLVGAGLAAAIPLLWRSPFLVRCVAGLLCVYPVLTLLMCVERHLPGYN